MAWVTSVAPSVVALLSRFRHTQVVLALVVASRVEAVDLAAVASLVAVGIEKPMALSKYRNDNTIIRHFPRSNIE